MLYLFNMFTLESSSFVINIAITLLLIGLVVFYFKTQESNLDKKIDSLQKDNAEILGMFKTIAEQTNNNTMGLNELYAVNQDKLIELKNHMQANLDRENNSDFHNELINKNLNNGLMGGGGNDNNGDKRIEISDSENSDDSEDESNDSHDSDSEISNTNSNIDDIGEIKNINLNGEFKKELDSLNSKAATLLDGINDISNINNDDDDDDDDDNDSDSIDDDDNDSDADEDDNKNTVKTDNIVNLGEKDKTNLVDSETPVSVDLEIEEVKTNNDDVVSVDYNKLSVKALMEIAEKKNLLKNKKKLKKNELIELLEN